MKKPDIIAALDMVAGCFEKLGIAAVNKEE